MKRAEEEGIGQNLTSKYCFSEEQNFQKTLEN